jgi:serine O-acetyltransferase
MGSAPEFAVVVPAFNRESTLARTAHTVLAAIDELERDHDATAELVIVDDGSIDGTAGVASDLARNDPRVRVVSQANSGVAAARNAGAASTAAEALVFIDCDDEVETRWLSALHTARSGPATKPALVFCDATAVHADGHVEHWHAEPLGPAFARIEGRFNPGMFCVDRDVFLAAGGYAVGLRFSENTELALRLTAQLAGDTGTIPTARVAEQLVHVYLPDRPVGSNAYNDRNRLDSARYIAVTHADRLGRIDPAFVAQYWSIAGVAAARLDRGAEARTCFGQAVRLQPGRLRYLGQVVIATIPPVRRRQWSATGGESGHRDSLGAQEPRPGADRYGAPSATPFARNDMTLRDVITADYYRYRRGGASSFWGVAQRQGFWAGLCFRVCHHLHTTPPAGVPRLARSVVIVVLGKLSTVLFGVEIQPGATIGPGLIINHFGPLVVHADAVIGEHCNLGHSVTIGVGGRGDDRGCPVIGDRVWIGPQCVIFGPITIGDDVAIGAGSIVDRSVPDRAVVAGNPAKVISFASSEGLLIP